MKRSLLATRFAAAAVLAAFAAACVDQREPAGPTSGDLRMSAPMFSAQAAAATAMDQHIVVLNGGIPGTFAAQVALLGGAVTATYREIDVAVVAGLSDDAAARLARTRGVAGIERDLIVQWIPGPESFAFEVAEGPAAQTDQSGTFFFPFWQWNLRQIQADVAWLTTNQGQGVRVAILDTGLDPTHADLAGKIDLADSRSMLTSSPCGAPDITTINDLNFHGSFVGALVSSAGFAMGSVAPDAQLIAVKVLACNGSGSVAGLIGGIIHATNVGADIINMSLGAYFPKSAPGGGPLVAALNRATNYANRNGLLVVAPAGNGGEDGIGDDLQHDANFVIVPAQSANVISVGATGPFQQMNFDQLATYTNFGVSGVDVMAPGGNLQNGGDIRDGIVSVCSRFSVVVPGCAPGNFYLIGGNGTSFASPHAAGTAAVVLSDFPDKSPAQLAQCVFKGADDLGAPGVDQQYSHGRINVVGAAAC